jgi:hypothetical protein
LQAKEVTMQWPCIKGTLPFLFTKAFQYRPMYLSNR